MGTEKRQDPWQQFMQWIERHADGCFFRGVSDRDFLLYPSVGRLENYSLENELNLFEHFKLKAKLFTNANNDYEWLTLAQHHGLHTRLLDWTENPLIAAFFACVGNRERSGRIYAVQSNVVSFVDNDLDTSPFVVGEIKFMYPPVNTRRIELQKGLFSIHPLPTKPVIIRRGGLVEIDNFYKRNSNHKLYAGLKPYLDDVSEFNEEYYHLLENQDLIFEILPEDKPHFEKNIRLLGIDETIYGDLDSIAKHLDLQVRNKRLHNIASVNLNYVKRLWCECVADEIPRYFGDTSEKFTGLEAGSVICNSIKVEIDDITDDNFGNKIIKGSCRFAITPNYLGIPETFIHDRSEQIKRCRDIESFIELLRNGKEIHESNEVLAFQAKAIIWENLENPRIREFEILSRVLLTGDKTIKDCLKLYGLLRPLLPCNEMESLLGSRMTRDEIRAMVNRRKADAGILDEIIVLAEN